MLVKGQCDSDFERRIFHACLRLAFWFATYCGSSHSLRMETDRFAFASASWVRSAWSFFLSGVNAADSFLLRASRCSVVILRKPSVIAAICRCLNSGSLQFFRTVARRFSFVSSVCARVYPVGSVGRPLCRSVWQFGHMSTVWPGSFRCGSDLGSRWCV